MELFPITLPKQNICVETALYYRNSKPVCYDETLGIITMDKKTVLSLDTYFNCFSYQKYLQYTNARILEVHLNLQGDVQVKLYRAELQGKNVQRTEVLTQLVYHNTMQEAVLLYDFSKETGNGFLYLELTALSKTAVFAGGYYASSAENINNTKVAVVICTYKREEYVKRNLKHLNQTVFSANAKDIADCLEVFVIDNGQTLEVNEIENEHIKLFPNKNYGGSGGFTRGIIETLRRKEEFSHVLLMDDDILLESNVLIKTIRFLQMLRPEHLDLAIGGSMLRLDDMTVQHEAGAEWTGIRILHGNHNIDLRDVTALLQNETLAMPQYNAWWYCCMPLCLIDENNLPLPFFIKVDDIEYGMRLIRKLLIMSGIGIWHEPFEKKHAPQLDYYDVRNKLVVNTLYEDKWLTAKNLFLLARYIGKNPLKGKPDTIAFPIQGCRDYLQGVSFFEIAESDVLHRQIGEQYRILQKQKGNPVCYWFAAGKTYLVLASHMLVQRKHLKKIYRTDIKKVTSSDFWCEKLDIEKL